MKNQPVRLAVLGASGKMGQRIISLAMADKRFQVVAGVEHAKHDLVGRLTAAGAIPIVGNLDEVLYKSDVVIDFTSPESTLLNATRAAKKGRGMVVGTTGLGAAAVKKLRELSRRSPIVFSPNMSLGMNLLFELVRLASERLAHFDIEIIESHHNLKKDAPSGTALRLAEIVADASRRSKNDFVFGREGLIGPRKKKEIGVFSVRAGDIVGDHTVLLSNTGERLELIHRAHSRDAFALGALDAAAWLSAKRPGFYSMADVLGFAR